jgi:pSer/pThr/pTyr-binding forkhead associated (FHA) protein
VKALPQTQPDRPDMIGRPELLGRTVIDVIDADGVVRERFRFPVTKSPITIGRSISCDVTVDDPYVAPMHAILEITPSGTARVSDTGSINGIMVDGKRHRSASGVALPNERLQIGRSTVRVRTAEAVLEPERVEQAPRKSRVVSPVVLSVAFAIAVAAYAIYERWLGAPQDLLTDAMAGVLYPFSLLGGWIAGWSLLTRIIRAEWRFAQHAAVALGVTLLYELVTEAGSLAFFVGGMRAPSWAGVVIGLAGCSLLLALHLQQASTLARAKVTVAALLVPLLLGGGFVWVTARLDRQGLIRSEAALRLYPPGLRLRPAEPVGDFFKRAVDLRGKADRRSGDTAKDAED